MATTRCRCAGRKSLPVAWRRRWIASSTTAASLTSASRLHSAAQPVDVGDRLDVEGEDRRHRFTRGRRRWTDSGRRGRRRCARSPRRAPRPQTRSAAARPPPEEMPAKMPSSRARRRAPSPRSPAGAPRSRGRRASARRSSAGRPRATCGCRGSARPRVGCTPITWIAGFFSLRKREQPMMVPVVPMVETKCVILPAVSRQISGPGALVVRERIVGVGELVEDHALARVAHLLGRVARELHAALLRRQHEARRRTRHRLAPLHRQVLGHHQHHAIAAHRRHHRERDAGVAAGRLDQRVARLDVGRAARRRAIIDSAGRSLTEPAGLLPSSLARMTLLVSPGDALQPHQRRVADEVLEGRLSSSPRDALGRGRVGGQPRRHVAPHALLDVRKAAS